MRFIQLIKIIKATFDLTFSRELTNKIMPVTHLNQQVKKRVDLSIIKRKRSRHPVGDFK